MDTSHENLYDMTEENAKPEAITEELKRQIYENTANIKHLQTDVGNIGELRGVINDVKSDMALLNKGVHADMASLKSSFTSKLSEFTLQIEGLKKDILENNSRLKWVRNLLFSVLVSIPATLLIGLNIQGKTADGHQKNMEKSIEIFETNLKDMKETLKSIRELKTK
jgi:hypothetical protein